MLTPQSLAPAPHSELASGIAELEATSSALVLPLESLTPGSTYTLDVSHYYGGHHTSTFRTAG